MSLWLLTPSLKTILLWEPVIPITYSPITALLKDPSSFEDTFPSITPCCAIFSLVYRSYYLAESHNNEYVSYIILGIGHWQWDHLSSYLFILWDEGLSILIKQPEWETTLLVGLQILLIFFQNK
jgi:hypothetical protein